MLKEKNAELLLLLRGLNSDSGSESKPAEFDGQNEFTLDFNTLHPNIAECRVFKTDEEIAVIAYANKVSSDAHREVMRRIRPGMYEYQLESLFKHFCYTHGGARHGSYTCICAA